MLGTYPIQPNLIQRNMNTYIGQKGYSILKKELTNEQIATLKAELFVRPYTPGAPVNNATGFKVYRESVS